MNDEQILEIPEHEVRRPGPGRRQPLPRGGSSSRSSRRTFPRSSPGSRRPSRACGTSPRSAAWTSARAFEIVYHFGHDAGAVNIKTRIPRAPPHIESITPIIPGAVLYERELQDMFGMIVEHLPDPRPLVTPDDWPAGNFPLRKDWTFERVPESHPRRKEMKFQIPIGPQHPALKEPISLRMTVEGEVIRDADIRLGYNHRGLEKLAEQKN